MNLKGFIILRLNRLYDISKSKNSVKQYEDLFALDILIDDFTYFREEVHTTKNGCRLHPPDSIFVTVFKNKQKGFSLPGVNLQCAR